MADKIKPWKLPPHKRIIIKNARIVDVVNNRVGDGGDVVVLKNGRIESIGASPSEIPEDKNETVRLDLEGKYLCPGLIDCHIHLTAVPGFNTLAKAFGNPKDVSLLRQPYLCGQILRRGFTSVRDCAGATLALKEAVEEGVFPGPRLFIAGKALSQTGGHGDLRGSYDDNLCCGGTTTSIARICDGVAECAKAARQEIMNGADFIKIMAGGGVSSPTDALTHLQFSPEEVRTIVGCASNAGTWVTAHAYTPEAIRHSIDNGVRGIEHGNFIDAETAKYMAEKGAFLTPTLVTYEQMASPEWSGFLPEESMKKNEVVLQSGLESLKIAHAAGVTMCYGTDLLGPLTAAQTREFVLRSQVLSSHEVLKMATVNAAHLLRQEESLGQIAAGFLADLIVLNRNPLEDVTILDNPEQNLVAVVKDGRVVYSRSEKIRQDVD